MQTNDQGSKHPDDMTTDELAEFAAKADALKKQAKAKAKAEQAEANRAKSQEDMEDPEGLGRPCFKITSSISQDVDSLIDQLSKIPGVYQQSGRIVRMVKAAEIKTDKDPEYDSYDAPKLPRRDDNAPMTREMDKDVLAYMIDKTACAVKFDGRKGDWKACDIPASRLKAVAEMGYWPSIPVLKGVSAIPIVRRDGSVFAEPNKYDEQTQTLFVDDSPQRWRVPEKPTKQDALQALEHIKDITHDFPFEDADGMLGVEGSEAFSAFVAMLLTPAARAAMGSGSAPLFSIDANTRGTGKTKQALLVGKIISGCEPTLVAGTADGEEMRKRLMSIVLSGEQIVVLDNLTGSLRSPELDAILTSGTFADRILGKSEMVRMPVRATFLATANNLVLGGDLDRRTIQVRMKSSDASPEHRTDFRYDDLMAEVDKKRQVLATSVVTILSGWLQSDGLESGQKVKNLGSFERWSQVVRGAIQWLGLQDPVKTQEKIESDNGEESKNYGAFYEDIWEIYGDGLWTTAMVVRYVEAGMGSSLKPTAREKNLRESLGNVMGVEPGKDSGGMARALSKRLKFRKGRQMGDFSVDAVDVSSVMGVKTRQAFKLTKHRSEGFEA